MASDQKGSLACGSSSRRIFAFLGRRYAGTSSCVSFLELGMLATPYWKARRWPGSVVMYLMYSQAHLMFCGLAPITMFRPEASAPTLRPLEPLGNGTMSMLPCCHLASG